mmetsp:Transcript_11246/g.34307  ORF Transcript_11246/g.34307 Transcript_11246/m.34307 type:complete len:202 (+) Transcript_11246:883-1488(+)
MALLSVLQGEGGRGGGLADAALTAHDDEALVSLGCRVGERRAALPQPSPKVLECWNPLDLQVEEGRPELLERRQRRIPLEHLDRPLLVLLPGLDQLQPPVRGILGQDLVHHAPPDWNSLPLQRGCQRDRLADGHLGRDGNRHELGGLRVLKEPAKGAKAAPGRLNLIGERRLAALRGRRGLPKRQHGLHERRGAVEHPLHR